MNLRKAGAQPRSQTEENLVHSLKSDTSPVDTPIEGAVVRDNQNDECPQHAAPSLKKRVGLTGGISLIVGTMIGSGIFVSPSGLALRTGSVAMSLVYWAMCGIISTMGMKISSAISQLFGLSFPFIPLFVPIYVGALCLAELGTFIPESGGEYVYLKAAFGKVPAYMFSWMSMLLLKPASASIMSLTCAEYVILPIMETTCGQLTQTNVKLLAAVIVLFLTVVNCFSVKLATRIQIVFTVAKLGAMLVIIIGGFVKMAQGYTEFLATGFHGTKSDIGSIALGLYSGMWAYDGWNNLNYVTEEIVNPFVDLPRSIMIAIPTVTLLYLLVNASYYTVMSLDDVINSPAVAVTFAARAWGNQFKWVEQILVATSTFGAVNGELFGASRLIYVAARDGHMLKVFSYIHIVNDTPVPSLVLTCLLTLCFIVPGDILSLIDVFNFAVWLFYGLTMLALIVLRYKRKEEYRPYKVALFLPGAVLLVSVFLVLAPIIDNPQIEFVYAIGYIVGGLLLYVPFVHYKKELPGIEAINKFVQILLQVTAPTTGIQH